ncbi:MAG: hypothetical protein ACR2NP_12110 [Pirellulaceae bacterium]
MPRNRRGGIRITFAIVLAICLGLGAWWFFTSDLYKAFRLIATRLQFRKSQHRTGN